MSKLSPNSNNIKNNPQYGLRSIALYIFLFWYGSMLSCSPPPPTKYSHPKESKVSLITLKKGILRTEIVLPGELISFQKVDLYAKENSFVKKVFVDIGSDVLKGTLLARLEAPELLSQLNSSKAKMKAQEALWLASKFTFSKLLETSKTPGTISPNDLQEALAKRNSDSAQYVSSRAALKEFEDRMSYLEIRAPFAGIISARNINDGAYVGPSGKGSDTPLFTLEEQKKLRLAISVPEDQAANLRKGAEAEFEIRSIPGKIFKAKLVRLGGSLSNALRSERLEMDIDNSDKKLLPGMTAIVSLKNISIDSTLLVPSSTVMETSRGVFVIKVDKDQKVHYINVKRGRENQGQIEISGDLNPGDHLVQIANEEIRDGSELRNFVLRP